MMMIKFNNTKCKKTPTLFYLEIFLFLPTWYLTKHRRATTRILLTCTFASIGGLGEVGVGGPVTDGPVWDPGLVDAPLHPLHDQIQQDVDGLADVLPARGAGLKVRDSVLLSQFPGLFLTDCPLVTQVTFVATQNHVWIFTVCMNLQLTHPVSDVEETLLIREIKQEEETHCISKKSRRQTSEPFLSRRVPQLQMDLLSSACCSIWTGRIVDHSSFSEVYSNCSDELVVELAICVLVQEARLSHTRVTQR